MLGMLTLGVVADRIGRRAGSLACAAFMLGGGVMLACAAGPTLEAWALMFAVSQVPSAGCAGLASLSAWTAIHCGPTLTAWVHMFAMVPSARRANSCSELDDCPSAGCLMAAALFSANRRRKEGLSALQVKRLARRLCLPVCLRPPRAHFVSGSQILDRLQAVVDAHDMARAKHDPLAHTTGILSTEHLAPAHAVLLWFLILTGSIRL